MSTSYPSDWLQEYPSELTLSILGDLAKTHANRSGVYRDELLKLIEEKRYEDIANYELDLARDHSAPAGFGVNEPTETPRTGGSQDSIWGIYGRGNRASDIREARQALAFFQKLEPLPIGVDKEAVAYHKFVKSEQQCRETNTRYRQMLSGEVYPPPEVAYVIHTAQLNIANVLGACPTFDQLKFGFGPGANTTVKARASSPRFKLGSRLACSSELSSMASAILEQAPQWCLLHGLEHCEDDDVLIVPIDIHKGRLQFVPKNAKTYRSIVVEPILNSFAQKGIGDFLKKRLRYKAGVDLSDQTLNQQLARKGSLDGSLATLDLSSASDTISYEVVADLLPFEWFLLLATCRTGEVTYRGATFRLEKFSSMGNGFTFELETLIFWAIARAVCTLLKLPVSEVSVYGDDIIVPTEAAKLLTDVLAWFGFSVNNQKSFSSGLFRESCGSDWYFGFDVRPYYQKTLMTGESLYTLHNFYARRFEFDMCEKVLQYLHPSLRDLKGPDGYGDGHLIGSYTGRLSKKLQRKGYEGVTFDTLTHKKRRKAVDRVLPGDRVLPVYSIYSNPQSDQLTDHKVVRGSSGYKRISIYTLARGVFLP